MMPTSAAERLKNESYNKLISSKTVPLKLIEFAPRKITMDESRVQNTASIGREMWAPSAIFSQRRMVYMPDELVDKRHDKVYEGERQTTAE